MLKFNKKKMFLVLMMLSTLMVLCSTKWLSMWLGMEINLMVTIPFIFQNKSKELSEKVMTYFLTQVMASILMLTAMLTMMMSFNILIIKMMLTFSMMIKLGMPPFHMWMPEMLNKINWWTLGILITMQKINPLMIMSQIMENNLVMPMIMIMSSSVGSLAGINQLVLSKIMVYSSINHLSWITMCMMMMNTLWIKYFIIYSMITLTLCSLFNMKMIFYINQFNMNTNIYMKLMIVGLMLNLGGLPPLPGFFIKWLTLESMMKFNYLYFTLIIMLFCSMVTLIFYMRLSYNMMMLSNMSQKFNKMITKMKFYMIMFLNMMLPLIIFI
uniref:NADH-ubiquinone oxidoreductase chain 2 n=1 Tax=Metasalis populi TaxID=1589681 RepID=A0A343WNN6_9HEMI|nr:NADH dehydrogenase subunit 2 [Metasalis populi]AWD31612.1 NADH dehydrogenase subunit 2 [Metasalis populi]